MQMIHETIKIQAEGSAYEGKLVTYFLGNSPEIEPDRRRPVVVICPGGAYSATSDREAEGIAMQFLGRGYHAAVLRYSTAPARFPEALQQLALAVSMLRERAEEWHIDPDKIVVQGSSAGGHLAASLGVFWKKAFLSERLGKPSEAFRPNGLMLSYPVITSGEKAHMGSFENLLGEESKDQEKRKAVSLETCVTEDVPPTFMWHTATDQDVPVENSLLFFAALHKLGIPAELHIYPVGGHGLGLATEETKCTNGYGIQAECQSWMSLAGDWMHYLWGKKETKPRAPWENNE